MIDPSDYSIKIIRGRYCLVMRTDDSYPVKYHIVNSDIIEQPIKQLYFEICTGYFKSTRELVDTIWKRNIERGKYL